MPARERDRRITLRESDRLMPIALLAR